MSYQVDLIGLQALCAANYARLQRLLPDMRERQAVRPVWLGEQLLVLRVLDNARYTTTLELFQDAAESRWLHAPRLEVRAYHDARLAEVSAVERLRGLRGRYGYPNAAMHQPDEKAQLNGFLAEWLEHGLAHGRLADRQLLP